MDDDARNKQKCSQKLEWIENPGIEIRHPQDQNSKIAMSKKFSDKDRQSLDHNVIQEVSKNKRTPKLMM